MSLGALIWRVVAAIALSLAIVPVAFAQPDTDPPELIEFDFNPKSVDVTSGPTPVTATMRVTDIGTGVINARFILHSPNGLHAADCSGNLISGDSYDGIYTCTAEIGQIVEEDTWEVEVWLRDLFLNIAELRVADLIGAGFPAELGVGFLPGAPLVIISHPEDAKRVRGNSLTIKAELAQGSPDDVSPTLGVRFDYRSLPSGVFAPFPARNANHPNPDTTYPYFSHWNLSDVPNGDYELRAVANDIAGVPDPAPETITVTVDHAGPVDVDENFTAESVQESHTAVDDGVESYVGSRDWTYASTAVELIVPAGALTSPTDTVVLNFPDPAGEAPLLDPAEQGIGALVDLTLQSGQTDLGSGLTGDLIVSYSDHDQDGYVDGTGIPESELELRYYDPVVSVDVSMPGWTVTTEHNMVHTETAFTGRFAVVPEPSRWLMLLAGTAFLGLLYQRRAR